MAAVFSANLGFLWNDLAIPARLQAAAISGFRHVEFHDDLLSMDPAKIRKMLIQLNLSVTGINVCMKDTFGKAALTGAEQEASRDFDDALRIAETIDAEAIHVLSGKTKAIDADAVFVSNLRSFADRTDKTVLIEPLCRAVAPEYWLNTIEQAQQVVDHVKKPNVKILFDIFHIHQETGNINGTWQRYRNSIGHVQIANPTTRQEPDQIASEFIAMIVADGWSNPIGAEYNPAKTVEAGLNWKSAAAQADCPTDQYKKTLT